ncbi:MAG TPA: dihydrolipoyl dehydrogenase [Myxococcales bacterium]
MATYDLAIIGSGPGGYVCAIRAGQNGLKTVVVEKDPRVGGTCTLRGCIPTKAVLHSADLLDEARRGAEIGVKTSGVELDMNTVRKFKEDVASKSSKGIDFLFRKNKVERLVGHGRLAGPGKVSVTGPQGEQIIEAKHVLLATGSAPRLIPGLTLGPRVMTSDELLENTVVPKRMIVLGAGAVGVEFASAYARFGSEVTLVEMLPRLLPIEDEDISAEFEKAFRRRKIKSLTSAKVEKVEVQGDLVRATVTSQKGAEVLEAELFLCAVGRRPVSENVDLEKFPNVKMERGFVLVDPATLLTGEPWLSAIGDVVALPGRPHPQLAHLAFVEGEFVADRLAGKKPHPVNYDLVPGATYSDPEVASIGLTEKAARERGYKVKIGTFPMSANGKARILGAAEGLVKVVGEEKYDEVLGVHIVGPRATELISDACSLLRLETTSEEMLHVMRPHPTLSETLTEAALAVRGKPLHI